MIRIVIVDDEMPMPELIAETIEKRGEGFSVVGLARDGAQALTVCRELKPDIVVTDIYMPGIDGLEFIAQAQQEGLNFKAVVISGRDEFSYARKAISLGVTDYLLKPFLPSELFRVLDKIKNEIERQRILRTNMECLQDIVDHRQNMLGERLYGKIIRGQAKAVTEEEKRLFDFSAKLFLAGYVCNTNGCLTALWDMVQEEELLELLQTYFPERVHMHGVRMSENQAALLFSCSEDDEDFFLRVVQGGLSHCQTSFKKHYNIPLRCALGGLKRDWHQLIDSYEEAQSAWNMQMKMDKPVLIYGENAPRAHVESSDASKQIRGIKHEILQEVRLGNQEAALERLNTLMKCYASLSDKKSDYIFISAGELVYAISNDIEEHYGKMSEQIVRRVEGTRRQIEYSSIMEMKNALIDLITACCQWVKSNRETTGGKRLMDQVLTLIHEEIANPDLGLEWLAERLNFSPHYIRQIFKQQVGENFSEYVIRRRMERAGTLLRASDMRVQDVAISCGYENQRYFASSFKKHYGMTPTEYKISLQEDV